MIQTERLQLVPPDLEYAMDLLEAWSDFEVVKYTYTPLVTNIEECQTYIKRLIERNGAYNYIILYNGKAIGICGCPPINNEKCEYGFYYQICRAYWGQGLGYEAARGVLSHVITNTQANVVFADAVSLNPASLSILSRLGFQKTHVQADGFNRHNLLLDLVHFKYDVTRIV